jgi:hypothetical protein
MSMLAFSGKAAELVTVLQARSPDWRARLDLLQPAAAVRELL